MTIADLQRELGVSRSWVYGNIDPEARRRNASLDGSNREQGRVVVYPRALVGRIIAGEMRASGFWKMHDFAENAPDREALAEAFDGPWDTDAGAWAALWNAVATDERGLLEAAVSHGPRWRAGAVEIPVPEDLLAEVRRGAFQSLMQFEDVRWMLGLARKSDEMTYRRIYEKNMVKIAVFGRTFWYAAEYEPAPDDGRFHARLKVPLRAFAE